MIVTSTEMHHVAHARTKTSSAVESYATVYLIVSQPLWDRGPVNSFFIKREPGLNKFTHNYLSKIF